MMAYTPKQWITEADPLGPPADPTVATNLSGEAITAEFGSLYNGVSLNAVQASGATQYQAQPQTLIAFDPTSGSGPVILPPAPVDRTQIGLKLVLSGALSVVTSALDTFVDGSTTWSSLSFVGQMVVWQYSAIDQVWYAVGEYIPDALLDTNYISRASANVVGTFTADELQADGVPGLTLPGRYVGRTLSGPPTDPGDGTFLTGDWVSDLTGNLFTCVSPGTWSGPGVAAAPVATTTTADGITNTLAVLHGIVNPNGLATTYQFEYGTTTAYGTSIPVSPTTVGSGVGDVPVSASLSSLTANTTYHFRVNAVSSGGTTNGVDSSFATAAAPQPPAVVENPLSSLAQTSVIVSGTIDPKGSSVTTYVVDYGTTTGYGSTVTLAPAPGAGVGAVIVSATVSGLTAGTGYHARIRATNANGTTNGADIPFTTLAAVLPPTAVTRAATNVSTSSVTLNGTTNPEGVGTSTHFDLGTTTGYGSSTAPVSQGSGSIDLPVSAPFTGLTQNQLYHFRLVAVSSAGTTNGADQTFTTLSSAIPPTVSLLPALTGTGTTGSTLTTTNGTWNGTTPLTFTRRWFASGVVIAGQTGTTYVVLSGDAGKTITCEVTATNAAGSGIATSNGITIAGTSGTLTFNGVALNFSPWAARGGSIHDDTTQSPSNYHYWGHVTWLGVYHNRPTVQLHVPSLAEAGLTNPPYTSPACELTSGIRPAESYPFDQYIGQSLWIPSTGPGVTSATGTTNVGEYHMSNIGGQPTWCNFLGSDHVTLQAVLGWYDGTRFQYSSSLPKMWAIPVGKLVWGAWNSWVIRILWSQDPTIGIMQSWYRSGDGTVSSKPWTAGSSLTGYPTLVWNTSPGTPPSTYVDNCSLNYCRLPSTGFNVYSAGFFEGTTFSIVAAQLP